MMFRSCFLTPSSLGEAVVWFGIVFGAPFLVAEAVLLLVYLFKLSPIVFDKKRQRLTFGSLIFMIMATALLVMNDWLGLIPIVLILIVLLIRVFYLTVVIRRKMNELKKIGKLTAKQQATFRKLNIIIGSISVVFASIFLTLVIIFVNKSKGCWN